VGIGPIEMGQKTSCVGTEVGARVVVAIEVDMGEVDLVELDQIKLVLLEVDRIEVDPSEDGLIEENPVSVDWSELDTFWIDLVGAGVNLVVVDLVKLGLEIPVENPVAEETLSEQEGFGGLLDELTTPGGGAVTFLLIVAREPGG